MSDRVQVGTQVAMRAYASPTLVLLALDWPDGAKHEDFLGFAIRRSPGHSAGEKDSYLLNKLSFLPPQEGAQPLPSNIAPIQKFLWWDAGITTSQRGKTMTYTATPVLGTGPRDLRLQSANETSCRVTIPEEVDKNGIGTYFNRAVVSSQAFSREFPDRVKQLDAAMDWLANGMQTVVPAFLRGAVQIDGAIYHLTDNRWIIPALKTFSGDGSLVYFWKEHAAKRAGTAAAKKTAGTKSEGSDDTVNQYAVRALSRSSYKLDKRTKATIMHDKFLVRSTNRRPSAVLMGSANFTPEALTTQANLLHTFDSAALARLYLQRQRALAPDPAVAAVAKGAAWSPPVSIGRARVRAFFPPEPAGARVSIGTVVKAVRAAKQSVLFCMFSPTDKELLGALLDSGDQGKLMFGLLNSITDPSQSKKRLKAIANGEHPANLSDAAKVQVDVYHRSRRDHKVVAYDYFNAATEPVGFLPEFSSLDTSKWSIVPKPQAAAGGSAKAKKKFVPSVHIHHKFIVIDAETAAPIIYTGSANMSENSTHRNDENLLEITNAPEVADVYFAEFLRLYEHYRARAIWDETHGGEKGAKKGPGTVSAHQALVLRTTRDEWVRGAYRRGTAEYRARQLLARPR